jgi:hypothetical protein
VAFFRRSDAVLLASDWKDARRSVELAGESAPFVHCCKRLAEVFAGARAKMERV